MRELDDYVLFEVFTDRVGEETYKAMQQELTGYMANPTYQILEPKNLLEVTRSAYTPSANEYMRFVQRGKSKTPAFRSLLLTAGSGRIAQIDVVNDNGDLSKAKIHVLDPVGPVVASAGEFFSEADAESPSGDRRRVYQGEFSATQTFRVAEGVPAGDYSLEVKLITPIYRNGEFAEIHSSLKRITFSVTAS